MDTDAQFSTSTIRKLLFYSTEYFVSWVEEKVDDSPCPYPQPRSSPTLPQTFVTSLIILRSLLSLQANFCKRCPLANLTRDLIALYTTPSSNPCHFAAVLQCFMFSLTSSVLVSDAVSDQKSPSSFYPVPRT